MADGNVTFVKDSGYRRNRKREWGAGTESAAAAKWEQDDTKFGVQSLKKLGWEEGKGLGIQQQGSSAPIKVKRLTDGKGLGSNKERTSDRWVANVTGYASVLQKLNAQYAAPAEAPAAAESAAQADFSQMGVMYKKRLKHKDMRSYSSTDLTAILGGVSKSLPSAEV
jgi:hypothetical protein